MPLTEKPLPASYVQQMFENLLTNKNVICKTIFELAFSMENQQKEEVSIFPKKKKEDEKKKKKKSRIFYLNCFKSSLNVIKQTSV